MGRSRIRVTRIRPVRNVTPELQSLIDVAGELHRSGVGQREAVKRLRSVAGGDRNLLQKAATIVQGRDMDSMKMVKLLIMASRPSDRESGLSDAEVQLLEMPLPDAFAVLAETEPRLRVVEAQTRESSVDVTQPPPSRWMRLFLGGGHQQEPNLSALLAVKRIRDTIRALIGPDAPGKTGLAATDVALGVALRHLVVVGGIDIEIPGESDR